jgi:hypothetical protein
VGVPLRTELGRLAAILTVIVCVGAASLMAIGERLYSLEQSFTAVSGWGHCIITCSGVPLSTVELLSGVTFPRGSTVLEADGAAPGGIGGVWAEATVRTPREHQLRISPASTVNGCLKPTVNRMTKWGVRHEHAGAVDGLCIQYGVTPDGDQIVHAYGAARNP